MSWEEEEKRLKENDETFTNPDKELVDKYKGLWEVVRPENKYKLETSILGIEKIIKGTNKIAAAYKCHADILAGPISLIVQGMQDADYFPKKCRFSKLTFLPNRSIFSLDALPKILETVMQKAFEPLVRKSYEHYDAFNMAYRKHCGTELCTAMSFIETERADEAVGQFFIDLKKGFNKCNRHIGLAKMQQICGAGKIMESWFLRRWYTYKGATRGWQFNTGVPAGTVLGPMLFVMVMDSNRAMTALNGDILWPGSYSDDDSPTFSMREIMTGRAQLAVDEANGYMVDLGCQYHVAGKKGPTMLVYKRKSQILSEAGIRAVKQLNIDNNPIRVVDKQKFLGINVMTRPLPELIGKGKEGEGEGREGQEEDEEDEMSDTDLEEIITKDEARVLDKYGYCLK